MTQTEKDFEIIIVDDGSTDDTYSILKSYEERYPGKIRAINQENKGSYIARRTGLREGKGEYFWCIDSDDNLLKNDALSIVKEAINKTHCDYLFFNATSDEVSQNPIFRYPYNNYKTFEGKDKNTILKLFLNTKEFCHMWNNVFKRDIVDWDSDAEIIPVRMLRDGPYQMISLLLKAEKIVFLNEVLYYYKKDNMASVSHNFKKEFFSSVIELHKRIERIYRGWEYKTDELQELTHKSFMYDISICAIKARNLNENSDITRIEYLKNIGSNEYFRKRFTLKGLEIHRKVICWMLYHHMYSFVDFVSSIVGLGKRVIHFLGS